MRFFDTCCQVLILKSPCWLAINLEIQILAQPSKEVKKIITCSGSQKTTSLTVLPVQVFMVVQYVSLNQHLKGQFFGTFVCCIIMNCLSRTSLNIVTIVEMIIGKTLNAQLTVVTLVKTSNLSFPYSLYYHSQELLEKFQSILQILQQPLTMTLDIFIKCVMLFKMALFLLLWPKKLLVGWIKQG